MDNNYVWLKIKVHWLFPLKTSSKNRFIQRIIIFREKLFQPFFRTHYPLSFWKKSEKSNEPILHQVQKTLFLGGFWTKFPKKNFFLKIGLRHFLGITILHPCAKNQKKLMSQSREKLVTDERTNEVFPLILSIFKLVL